MQQYIIMIEWLGGHDAISMKDSGLFLKYYDPDTYEGRGEIVLTPYVEEALKFPSPVEAQALYTKVSTVHPRRTDGKPNRPLTAYTISVVPIPKEQVN